MVFIFSLKSPQLELLQYLLGENLLNISSHTHKNQILVPLRVQAAPTKQDLDTVLLNVLSKISNEHC